MTIKNKKQETRNSINWFLLLRLAGIVIFIIILSRIDIQEVWAHLRLIRWNIIVITLGLVMSQLTLKALRWHLLNIGTHNAKNLTRSFGEFFESYAIGIVTPGRLGEMLKAGYSPNRGSKISTGVRVLVERGFDFGFFLCIAGFALVFSKIINYNLIWGILTVSLGLLSVGFSVSLLRSGKAHQWLEKLLIFLRINKEPLDNQLRSCYFSLQIILISLVSNSVYFLSCYFLARSISFEAGFLFISGGVAVAGLLNTIPMTVMGLGTRELAFLFVFAGYPAAVIMAFSALVFLCWQVGSGVLSIISGEILMLDFSKRKKIKK